MSHSNICSVHEIGDDSGRTYIAMESVEGVTLKARLAATPMEIEEALDIAIQIADALNEA